LFYGLSLGFGLATIVAVWCRACSALADLGGETGNLQAQAEAINSNGTIQAHGRWSPVVARLGPWAALLIPGWALASGDSALAVALAALVAATAWTQSGGRAPSRRALALRASVLVWFLAALSSWATAPEGAFTRLRDQWLLPTPVGALVNHFYYRWTLYPAEALKPLAARSQPTVWVGGDVPPAHRDAFCAQARRVGLLCVDAPEASDLTASLTGGGVALTRGGTHMPWPGPAGDARSVWQEFSRVTDRARPLRKATALSLVFGCPLALCWALASLAIGAGDLFGSGRRSAIAAHVAAAFVAASLFSAGLPERSRTAMREALSATPPSRESIRKYATSDDPVARFYATRAAGRRGGNVALLLQALSDPVINVRYAAAEALGRTGGPQAREALREVLVSPEAWYVKERAYSGLWKLGWRPE
jgi:hypothetical protein